MYYLTEADYKIAKDNGIPRNVAYHRYYDYKWDVESSITDPVGTYKRMTPNVEAWEQWKDIAESNRVTRTMFFNRLNKSPKRKWTPEEAATTPKGVRKSTKISKEIYELAEKNGIKKTTLRNRIFNLHWNHVRAATDNGTVEVEGVLV